jgi:hypothetical protein
MKTWIELLVAGFHSVQEIHKKGLHDEAGTDSKRQAFNEYSPNLHSGCRAFPKVTLRGVYAARCHGSPKQTEYDTLNTLIILCGNLFVNTSCYRWRGVFRSCGIHPILE